MIGGGSEVSQIFGINCSEYGGVIFKMAGFSVDEFKASKNILISSSVGASICLDVRGLDDCFVEKTIDLVSAGSTYVFQHNLF